MAGDGKIYVVNQDGVVFVIRAGDRPQLVATVPMEEQVVATPALADGALFVRTEGNLYCFAAGASPSR